MDALLYFVAAFVFWLVVYRAIYMLVAKEGLSWDRSDRTFAVLWGGFVACCWPITLPLAILGWIVMHPLQGVLKRFDSLIERTF